MQILALSCNNNQVTESQPFQIVAQSFKKMYIIIGQATEVPNFWGRHVGIWGIVPFW